MAKRWKLSKKFPFRNVFEEFLREYASCTTYWYIPKARSLGEAGTVAVMQTALAKVAQNYLEATWNQDTQDNLLKLLVKEKVMEPYKKGTKVDRTALIRINKKLWEVLGLLWVEEDASIVITDAGSELIDAWEEADPDRARKTIEVQIAKWQYPNPSDRSPDGFRGIIPHLFLLQVLQKVDYRVSYNEFDLFLNLAQGQDDLPRIVKYIRTWRELSEEEQTALVDLAKEIPMAKSRGPQEELFGDEEGGERDIHSRYKRISQDSSYQRGFFAYPSYLETEDSSIICRSRKKTDVLVREKIKDLKILEFANMEDWIAYYGDPTKRPSWFTYISHAVERAKSEKEAAEIAKKGRKRLKKGEFEEIERKMVEKSIEDFYEGQLHLIEKGLMLMKMGKKSGRQFSTPIGAIDLLCKDKSGSYVVIEIKAGEANDAVFGQILRYMGWIHRSLEGGFRNVRGIIVAQGFPDKARYSRIGLEPLNKGYKKYLGFRQYGLDLQDI